MQHSALRDAITLRSGRTMRPAGAAAGVSAVGDGAAGAAGDGSVLRRRIEGRSGIREMGGALELGGCCATLLFLIYLEL